MRGSKTTLAAVCGIAVVAVPVAVTQMVGLAQDSTPTAAESSRSGAPAGCPTAAVLIGDHRVGVLGSDCEIHEVVALDGGATATKPVLSPNGDEVAFVRVTPKDQPKGFDPETAEFDSELAVVGVSTGRVDVVLGEADYFYYDPSWRNDGKALTFTRVARDAGNPSVRTVDLQTGEETLVNQAMTAQDCPAWSIDGSTVLFTRSGDPAVLIEQKVGSDTVRTIEDADGVSLYCGVYSADGDSIAAIYNPEPDGGLDGERTLGVAVLDADEGTLTSVIDAIDAEGGAAAIADVGWYDVDQIVVSAGGEIIFFDRSLTEQRRIDIAGTAYFD